MDRSFEYTLKRYRKSRNIRVIVKPGGKVVVTAPWRAPRYLIERFLVKQAEWIVRAQGKMSEVAAPVRKGTQQEYLQYKKESLEMITQRLRELNQYYNFQYKKISVRNQSSRWGSCSRSGTLSFSYRLLFLPPELRDYVLVHELCHLAEMNHSQKFWKLIAQTVPNYQELRKQLRLS